MSDKPKHQMITFEDGTIGFPSSMSAEDWREWARKRKEIATKSGHVTRRIIRDERLKGKTLEFALDVLGVRGCDLKGSEDGIAGKLVRGEKLTDYEKHLVVDVYLLHYRL